jgi:hypothetical protein
MCVPLDLLRYPIRLRKGVLISGCGVLWGDETAFNLEALLPEGEDVVLSALSHPDRKHCSCDEARA